MERYHFLYAAQRLHLQVRLHRYEDAWPWTAASLAFLLALLPGNFQDYLNIEAVVWETTVIVLLIGSIAMMGWSLFKGYLDRVDRAKTPEQIVDDVIEEIEASYQRSLEAQKRRKDL